MANIISNEIFDFPLPESGIKPTTEEQRLAYFEQIKNFFINTLNFYQYGNTVQTYDNHYVYYFSDSQSGEPCFCIVLWSNDIYYLCPCLYKAGNNSYEPSLHNFTSESFIKSSIYPQISGIIFDLNGTYHTTGNTVRDFQESVIVVQKINLEDGRKIILFKAKTKENYEDYYVGTNCCLYYTRIYSEANNNNFLRKWIIFSDAPNTSYISEIETTASFTNRNYFHQNKYLFSNPNSMLLSGGQIPNLMMNKDYLLKLPNFYIGDNFYISEISLFSKVKNLNSAAPVGTILTIKGKDYIILWNHDDGQTGNTGSIRTYQVATPSLIIPIESPWT